MNRDSDKKEIWAVNQYPVELKSFLSGKLCNSIADGDDGYSYGELIGIGWQSATASMQEEIDQKNELLNSMAMQVERFLYENDRLQAEVEALKAGSQWIIVNDDLPVIKRCETVEVYGWIAPYGYVSNGVEDIVKFDGDEWYDIAGRTCTVTHWKPKSEPPKTKE
jgi:hypothetical protein